MTSTEDTKLSSSILSFKHEEITQIISIKRLDNGKYLGVGDKHNLIDYEKNDDEKTKWTWNRNVNNIHTFTNVSLLNKIQNKLKLKDNVLSVDGITGVNTKFSYFAESRLLKKIIGDFIGYSSNDSTKTLKGVKIYDSIMIELLDKNGEIINPSIETPNPIPTASEEKENSLLNELLSFDVWKTERIKSNPWQSLAFYTYEKTPKDPIFKPKRFDTNPLLYYDKFNPDYQNFTGPSVIKTPDWDTMGDYKGKYFLYFAHHKGKFIRLAIGDKIEGPYEIHKNGVLPIEEAEKGNFSGHIASPQVIIDEENKQIVLFFHAKHKYVSGQFTGVAISKDGLNFELKKNLELIDNKYVISYPYLKIFRKINSDKQFEYYGIARWFENDSYGGMQLLKSKSLYGPYTNNRNIFIPNYVRHVGVLVDDTNNKLHVFWTQIGDYPERILRSTLDISDSDYNNWKFEVNTINGEKTLKLDTLPPDSWTYEVMRPEEDYEGINTEHVASESGAIKELAWQLRDPGLYVENGKKYIFYSCGGEYGIAGALLEE